MWDDLRHAIRSLRRSGRTTAVAILLFAVTIGVTTAIYAVVEAVILRPSAMRRPDRTVVIWQRDDARSTPVVEVSYGEVAAWQQGTRRLDALGAFSSVNWSLSLIQGESRSRVSFAAVSPSFFEVVGVAPAQGRVLTDRDEAAAEARVAVLSHDLWRQRFAGDPHVVGSVIRVRAGVESPELTLEVVGVMPPQFDFPRGTQLWLPAAPSIRAVARTGGRNGDAFLSGLRVFYGLGRMRDGVSAEQAAQEIGAMARRQNLADAAGAVTGAVATPVDVYLQGAARPILWIMLGGALVMVLLACSSIAGLQVFRAALADRALAVHLALGAMRRRLVTRAIAEGLLLALAGVAGALAVATVAVTWFVSAAPLDIPRLGTTRLTTLPVMAFMALVAATVGVLAGVWPALFVSRIDASGTLTSGARAVMHPRERRFQRLVVGWQVAVAVVLLAGAALFVRSVQTLDRTDVGFRADGLVALEVKSSFREAERSDVFYDALLSRTRDLPGVTAAGAMYLRPLSGPIGNDSIPVLAGQEGLGENAPWRRNPRANLESIVPGSFQALGVPIVSGRDFTPADTMGARDAVIVSASAAARYWPGRSAIGQRLVVAGQRNPPPEDLRWQTVVGVVGDVRYRGLLDPRLDIYLPAAQSSMRVKDMVVRMSGDPESVIARVRAIARELDPGVFVGEIALMKDALARESAPWRFAMRILTFFGALAALLATVGLVGVVWLVLAIRRRELGVRAALGATPAQLQLHVLRDAAWTGAVATLVGTLGALAFGRVLGG
ncbi:MAG TPA: ABC transporter permease, partial [Vicinamibacterales bacterium]|nr:ABC transporter permease [Vicinamibacterales bacterium]